jgi:drug/metabolite transporter (DMT)-like permease
MPILALIAAMLLWGSSFVALKLAFRYYDPMVVIFGRMLVGSLCMLLFMGRFRRVRYQKGDYKSLLLLALFEPCLYFTFEAAALSYTTASQAGMITAMLPLMVAVAATFVLGEHITRRTLFGFILAIAGVVWLSLAGQAGKGAPNPLLGNFLEFVAMACATGYTIMAKKLSPRYGPLLMTAIQSSVGTLFFFPLMFLPPTTFPETFSWGGLFAILYLGAFVTMGAYFGYNYGISRIPASQAASFTNLIPVFSVLLGWLILGETFTWGQYAASIIVLTGVFLSQNMTARRSRGT